jgi:type IV secretion system protein VirD4
MMLDEFAALGRLDFFETALAFMAGYGIRAYLIAQSLNQIAKAYGDNNAILDNCHVRIAFSSNDERTAKRISDALGTATELHAQHNYAGHRLAPWLGHVSVSRQQTPRPLLTPGEIMQLPPGDALVMVSGLPPIRARKLRYYQDRNFLTRLCPAPSLELGAERGPGRSHDWQDGLSCVAPGRTLPPCSASGKDAAPVVLHHPPPGDFFSFVTGHDEAQMSRRQEPAASHHDGSTR